MALAELGLALKAINKVYYFTGVKSLKVKSFEIKLSCPWNLIRCVYIKVCASKLVGKQKKKIWEEENKD